MGHFVSSPRERERRDRRDSRRDEREDQVRKRNRNESGDISFLFFPENRLTLCLYWRTICIKCQILFSGENKKNISKCHLLKIYPEC